MSNESIKIDLEKEKEDWLIDYILEFKQIRGYLPKNLILNPEWIPQNCKKEMSITIDDQPIPIYPMGVYAA